VDHAVVAAGHDAAWPEDPPSRADRRRISHLPGQQHDRDTVGGDLLVAELVRGRTLVELVPAGCATDEQDAGREGVTQRFGRACLENATAGVDPVQQRLGQGGALLRHVEEELDHRGAVVLADDIDNWLSQPVFTGQLSSFLDM
jgi:GNAT superfamily N-acetyltransferase